MIEWHKASEELPKYGESVFVAEKTPYDEYLEDSIYVARLFCENNENVWSRGNYIYWISDDDQWAYVNLPNPKKDGDSD